MTSAAAPSLISFLSRLGVHSRWTEAVLFLLIVYGAIECYLVGRSETTLYMVLFATPFAAGTGLLSVARSGQLDLLLGAGASREAIWRHTLVRSVGLPLATAIVAAAMFASPRMPAVEVAARATGIVLFTAGVSFATGLSNPRYVAAVVWFGARLGLLMSSAGAAILGQLKVARGGGAAPEMSDLFLSALAFPEILLDPSAHGLYVALVAALGLVAIVISRFIFSRAEFAGRRSA